MTNQSENYQSYLIRFRRPDRSQPWRFSARSVMSEEQFRFETFEALIAFLESELDIDSDWEIKVSGVREA